MMKIRTRPLNIRPASSLRAVLNSSYCMRAQVLARSLVNGEIKRHSSEEFFSYQEGQHRLAFKRQRQETNGKAKLHLPEEVKIEKTKDGKRWNTSSMKVELAKDMLEIRDGLGKIVDTVLLDQES